MMHLTRSTQNPILLSDTNTPWEKKAVFNGSVVKVGDIYHMVYRAVSDTQVYKNQRLALSTIGQTTSKDAIHFSERKQFIIPSESWDAFGCEDPRLTYIDNEYFLFYTALSDYPFRPNGIKIGLATFSDFDKPIEKHLVTPFNAKAMVLFPEKINGKYVALLTVNTDIPPSRIAIAWFDKKEDIWSQSYWNTWYQHLSDHILPVGRINSDQVEVGAVPIPTEKGWLLLYSHIQHYYKEEKRLFGAEALLLDKENPQIIRGRTDSPILLPEAHYEKEGEVQRVIFPSGGLIKDKKLLMYYGAADSSVCLAVGVLDTLFENMRFRSPVVLKLQRPLSSPLLSFEPTHEWEAKAVFNPAAFADNGTIHIVYRAMGFDNTSVFGYATTNDGTTITKRNEMPIYVPRARFETKKEVGNNSGCEDPRITKIDEMLYMCYTAYDGVNPPRVAFTSLAFSDFFKDNFNWKDPVLISPPGITDKDAALFPEKINGKYVFIHRIQHAIVFDTIDSLDFNESTWLRSLSFIPPHENSWDSEKVGLCTPPIRTEKGWFVLYHGVSTGSHMYRVGAMLLDLHHPEMVIARTPWPLLEPEASYEKEGYIANVVFPCGAVVKNDTLFVYYGAADTVVGVATTKFSLLLDYLMDYTNGK